MWLVLSFIAGAAFSLILSFPFFCLENEELKGEVIEVIKREHPAPLGKYPGEIVILDPKGDFSIIKYSSDSGIIPLVGSSYRFVLDYETGIYAVIA